MGRITTGGVVSEYPLPSNGYPWRLVTGPDAAIWFTYRNIPKIGRITPSGVVDEFPTSGTPYGIVTGTDGALWFAEENDTLGRLTTAGVLTEYIVPTKRSNPSGIAVGSDGKIWFTEFGVDKIASFAGS